METIDFKIDECCVYLPTRNCLDAYKCLAFFGQDVEGVDICCVGDAAVIFGIVESTVVTDVDVLS